jgi:hypothetical protein
VIFVVIGFQSTFGAYRQRPNYKDAVSIVAEASVNRPLIVHSRQIAYPLVRYTHANPQVVRISYLFRGDKLNRFDEVENAVARRMADLFDLPGPIEAAELASLNEFDLLAEKGQEQRYVGWTAEPINGPEGSVLGYDDAALQAFRMTRKR